MSEVSLAYIGLRLRRSIIAATRRATSTRAKVASALLAVADLAADPVDAALAAQCADQEAGAGQAEGHHPGPVDAASTLADDQCPQQEAEQPPAQAVDQHLDEQVAPGA